VQTECTILKPYHDNMLWPLAPEVRNTKAETRSPKKAGRLSQTLIVSNPVERAFSHPACSRLQ